VRLLAGGETNAFAKVADLVAEIAASVEPAD